MPLALIRPSAVYPDDSEFQSPVFDDPETIKAFDTEFLRLKIAATSNQGNDYVPKRVRRVRRSRQFCRGVAYGGYPKRVQVTGGGMQAT